MTDKTPKQLMRDNVAKQYRALRRVFRPIKVVKQTEAQTVKQEGRA